MTHRLRWFVALVCLAYATLLAIQLRDYFFNSRVATGDARQQLYPLWEAVHPGVFEGDPITDYMKGYLPPAHRALAYALTKATRDPIGTGSLMMFLQYSISLALLFPLVRRLAGATTAFFSLLWFLHTRDLMYRMSSGMPRGWATPIVLGYLYLLFSGRYTMILGLLLLGSLLNPPAVFVVAVTHTAVLLWRVARPDSRRLFARRLVQFALACPLIAGAAWLAVRRPASAGELVSLAEARSMPAFDREGGRFRMLPFLPAQQEIATYGLQAFVSETYRARPWVRGSIPYIAAGVLAALLAAQLATRRPLFPAELVIFLAAAFAVYFASRWFAFHLYVPDRHLRYPLNLFLIVAVPVAIWRLLQRGAPAAEVRDDRDARGVYAVAAFAALGALVCATGGRALQRHTNLSVRAGDQAPLHSWLSASTPLRATIAGHPTTLDGVPLFARRRAYITTETAHPFYDRYYEEAKRRLRIALRAHYASSAREFMAELGTERIDYFVFDRRDFTPEALAGASYDKPLNRLVRRLAERPAQDYFATALASLERSPAVVFRQDGYTVVDVAALRRTHDLTTGRLTPPASLAPRRPAGW